MFPKQRLLAETKGYLQEEDDDDGNEEEFESRVHPSTLATHLVKRNGLVDIFIL